MALYEYRAILREIHDADTVILDIDQGFSDWKHNQKIRLDGLDRKSSRSSAGSLVLCTCWTSAVSRTPGR
jgi:hypothetical protein